MKTDKQWVVDAVAHRPDVPAPWNISLCPPAAAALRAHLGLGPDGDIKDALGLPIRTASCQSIKPQYASVAEFGSSVTDEFGVAWSTNDIDRGSPIGHPLAEATLAGYRFPDPAAAHRFAPLEAWCGDNASHFTILWVGELWERATFLRGMENILLDVAMEEAFVGDLLRKLADHVLATMAILLDRFSFDAVALSDDYGSQQGMLMSPAAWRRLIKPLLAEIYALAKSRGRYMFHHSCGNIVPIIGDMIDIGLDILHPIQPEAMDVLELKRRFGGRLTLCGGLGTQDLLPKGSAQDVRREVRRLKETLGRGGGYILEPGITIQGDVPLENILALIDEARSA